MVGGGNDEWVAVTPTANHSQLSEKGISLRRYPQLCSKYCSDDEIERGMVPFRRQVAVSLHFLMLSLGRGIEI